MCLDYELTKNQADKIKTQARKRGYIRVWKVCKKRKTGWYFGSIWKKGLRKAMRLNQKDGGWYAHLSLEDARKYANVRMWLDLSVKACYAKPSWIKCIGGDLGKNLVGIFTHLAFPDWDWDKGDMTTREFRAMCRENKP